MLRSIALLPPTFQKLHHFVVAHGRAPLESEFDFSLNEGVTKLGKQSKFKLWRDRLVKAYVEYFLFHNLSTEGQYFLVLQFVQGWIDRARLCFGGSPNATAMYCRTNQPPFVTVPNCRDQQILSSVDTHPLPLTHLCLHVIATIDHLHRNGVVKEIITPFGTERILQCVDPISGAGTMTLTDRHGLDQGMCCNLIVGKNAGNDICVTQVKMTALLEYANFEVEYQSDTGTLTIKLEPSELPDKLRRLVRLVHGFVYFWYDTNDRDAVAPYTIRHYIAAVGLEAVRSAILEAKMVPEGLSGTIIEDAFVRFVNI